METTGFVILSREAIMAAGPTPEAVLKELLEQLPPIIETRAEYEALPWGHKALLREDFDKTYYALPATAALLAEVAERGGAIAWEEIKTTTATGKTIKIACTRAEAEQYS